MARTRSQQRVHVGTPGIQATLQGSGLSRTAGWLHIGACPPPALAAAHALGACTGREQPESYGDADRKGRALLEP